MIDHATAKQILIENLSFWLDPIVALVLHEKAISTITAQKLDTSLKMKEWQNQRKLDTLRVSPETNNDT
jgi:hypothetical protein